MRLSLVMMMACALAACGESTQNGAEESNMPNGETQASAPSSAPEESSAPEGSTAPEGRLGADAFGSLPDSPVAEKRPIEWAAHGDVRVDEYHWMRDDNWQQVLREPELLREEVRVHLDAENAYLRAAMADTEALQETLFQEMKGRIKEDDSTVPAPDGPFAYYVRFEEGAQYPIYARTPRDGGSETVLIDGNARAEGADFYALRGVSYAPHHQLLAFGEDRKGSEYYTIRVKDLETGELRPDVIESTDGGAVWANNGLSFFYVERDDNQRPRRVKRHVLGTNADQDTIVYEEENLGFFLGVDKTRSDRFIVISSGDNETSKAYVLDADLPEGAPRLIAEAEKGVQYSVSHRGDRFYIRTNADGATDFKIVSAPVDAPDRANWEDVVPHRPGVYVLGVAAFRDYLVRLEREDALPRIVVDPFDGEAYEIAFDEAAYSLGLEQNREFATNTLRFSYESPTTPEEIYDYDMAQRARALRKRQEVPSGHDPSLYVAERLAAPGHDGVEIPVTVLRRKDVPVDGSAPLHLYAYGSYGLTIPATFSIRRLSLADRGVITAIAHIRGGAAKGRQWYLDGKLDKKVNSFRDYISSAEFLADNGYGARGRIAAQGGSAGGLLMGGIANMAPELFAGVVAEVPFVDVVTTISDAELPLTPPEWPEWGNPIEDETAYRTMLAYSPYDNVADQAYPPILATAGLTDYRVTYWEPAKWVARLRDRAPNGGPYFMKTNMGAGHGGASGRFDALKEDAFAYAFILKVLGIADRSPAP